MDRISTGNDEFGFDDNGLQDALLLSSWQTSVSSDCSGNNGKDDSPLNHCDEIPTEIPGYESTDIENGQGVLPGSVGVTNDEGNKQSIPKDEKEHTRSSDQTDKLDPPISHIDIEKEAERTCISAIGSGEVKLKNTKFKSKYGGFYKSILYTDSLSSLAAFSEKFGATILWRLLISVAVGILFLLPSVGVDGAFTSVPVNNLFVVGKTARINCATDLNESVFWGRTLVGSDVQQWLYFGNDGFNSKIADGRFRMDKNEATGRYDLIIDDAQQKDAGQYVCIDESGGGARASADLVVADPIQCHSHIPSDGVMGYNVFGLEQDVIQIYCSLTYTGNTPPTLEWIWPRHEVRRGEPTVSTTSSVVTSTLQLPPEKEYNGVKFKCQANIADAKHHAIDSGLLWESETVNVRYAEFASMEADGCPGIEFNLICNPPCSHNFEREDHKCRCVYTYYMHDSGEQREYKIYSEAVGCDKDNESQPVVLIVAVVAIVLLVLIPAITLACICCQRMNKTTRYATHVRVTN